MAVVSTTVATTAPTAESQKRDVSRPVRIALNHGARMKVPGPLLDEGLLHILAAGGCHCEPPGSGEEFCTGHCVLRAEAQAQIDSRDETLIAAGEELARRQAQIERLRAVLHKIADDSAHADQYVHWAQEALSA